jgi:hypothetical protein
MCMCCASGWAPARVSTSPGPRTFAKNQDQHVLGMAVSNLITYFIILTANAERLPLIFPDAWPLNGYSTVPILPAGALPQGRSPVCAKSRGALRPFVGIPPVMHDPTVRSPDRATRASLPRSHLAFDAQYGVKTDVQTSNEAAVQMSMKIEGALFRLKDMVLGCQIRLSASKRLR